MPDADFPAFRRNALQLDHFNISSFQLIVSILFPKRATQRQSAITKRRRIISMAKVVKVIELMSQSPKSWEDAAQGAIDEASKTLRNIRSLYVNESTVEVDNGKSATIGSTPKSH